MDISCSQTLLQKLLKIKEFLSTLDPTFAISIQKISKLFSKDGIKNNLIYISVNFEFLENTIK